MRKILTNQIREIEGENRDTSGGISTNQDFVEKKSLKNFNKPWDNFHKVMTFFCA
jgi:hypothetical protein